MKTVIIIPTYNERDNIKELIPAIFFIIPQAVVVIVDDNSPDATSAEVWRLKKKYSNLHLVKRKKKAGRGSAVIEGFKYAHEHINAQIYIEMDADFSHDPKELAQLIKLSKPKTIVLASRYVAGSKIINWPISRRLTSHLANFLIRFVLGIPIKDNTNGLRCYSKEAVHLLINRRFITQGHVLLSESAYLLYKNGFRYVEISTIFRNRIIGQSNATISEFINALKDLFRIKKSFNI